MCAAREMWADDRALHRGMMVPPFLSPLSVRQPLSIYRLISSFSDCGRFDQRKQENVGWRVPILPIFGVAWLQLCLFLAVDSLLCESRDKCQWWGEVKAINWGWVPSESEGSIDTMLISLLTLMKRVLTWVTEICLHPNFYITLLWLPLCPK